MAAADLWGKLLLSAALSYITLLPCSSRYPSHPTSCTQESCVAPPYMPTAQHVHPCTHICQNMPTYLLAAVCLHATTGALLLLAC